MGRKERKWESEEKKMGKRRKENGKAKKRKWESEEEEEKKGGIEKERKGK
jgi:hypothetical protein